VIKSTIRVQAMIALKTGQRTARLPPEGSIDRTMVIAKLAKAELDASFYPSRTVVVPIARMAVAIAMVSLGVCNARRKSEEGCECYGDD
jgi:hypothetical protein